MFSIFGRKGPPPTASRPQKGHPQATECRTAQHILAGEGALYAMLSNLKCTMLLIYFLKEA